MPCSQMAMNVIGKDDAYLEMTLANKDTEIHHRLPKGLPKRLFIELSLKYYFAIIIIPVLLLPHISNR